MSSSSSGVRSAERRRFLKLVGLAGLSTAIGSAMTAWAEPRPVRGVTKPAAPPRATAPAPAAAPPNTAHAAAAPAPEISEDARALAAILERRYARHLDKQQLEKVTQEIEYRLQGGKRLRDRRLANSDEPDFTFHA